MSDAERPPLSDHDYELILGAVMETARGRWFLAEHARRNRHADTQLLLEALARIERNVRPSSEGADLALRRELVDLADRLSLTRREIAATAGETTGELAPDPARVYDDAIALAERADKDVANAAEHVQEIAWGLRETRDADRAAADLDSQAMEIYRASSRLAQATRQLRMGLGMLPFVEARLNQLADSWGDEVAFLGDQPEEAPASGLRPQTLLGAPRGGSRTDIAFDEAAARKAPLAETPPPGAASLPGKAAEGLQARDSLSAARSGPPGQPRSSASPRKAETDPRIRAFAAIDGLPPEQRLALFA